MKVRNRAEHLFFSAPKRCAVATIPIQNSTLGPQKWILNPFRTRRPGPRIATRNRVRGEQSQGGKRACRRPECAGSRDSLVRSQAVDSLAVVAGNRVDVQPIFFFTAPLRKPRTEWGCQPVAFLSSGSEAPAGLRSRARILAVLVPRRAATGGLVGAFGFLAALGAAAVEGRLEARTRHARPVRDPLKMYGKGKEDEIGLLLEQYRAATEAYAKAVNELLKWRGMVSLDEYTRLVLIAQSTREECERIRVLLSERSKLPDPKLY